MNWKDAYEKQMSLWEWLRSDLGRRHLRNWAKAECQSSPTKYSVFEMLVPYEEDKVLQADPVYVSEDMIDLIEFAKEGWQPEMFLEEDVLVPHAFIYLARPTYLHDRHGNTVNVRAISYCPIISEGAVVDDEGEIRRVPTDQGIHPTDSPREQIDLDRENIDWTKHLRGLAVTLYSDLGDLQDEGAVKTKEMIAEVLDVVPDLVHLHMTPVWFGMEPDGESWDVDHPEERTAYEEWWTLMQVLLKMMTQNVAARQSLYPDRHSRRRGLRRGFDPREVLVVKLRRPRHEPTGSERDVNWTHQWLVGGHWRNQWMPSLNRHRQTWIGTYVKGPEGTPLIVKRKAYEWTR